MKAQGGPMSRWWVLALSVSMGCKAGVVYETGDTEDTEDSGDTSDTDDSPVDPAAWTKGPPLPDCEPVTGSGTRVALSGVVLTPDGPVAGAVVYDKGTGRILCAGADCDTAGAELVCTQGVISPGLVGTHDHLQYNILGPWRHNTRFGDRYAWQSASTYRDFRAAYDEIDDAYACEIVRWAELRYLVAGATTAVGAVNRTCIRTHVRNLDEGPEAHGLQGYGEVDYSSGRVTSLDASDARGDLEALASGDATALLNHVAEGVDGRVRSEIDHMDRIGLGGPGVVFVHATDATTAQLARMASEGTGIAWSPRSNLDLYDDTTPIDVAARLGVPVAVGPDWTWSGSASPTAELSCAWDWLRSRESEIGDVQLWRWMTDDAARLVGVDGEIGALAEGMLADIAVYPWSDEPYRSVIRAEPDAVKLTVIGGDALYGQPDWIARLARQPNQCETVTACGQQRSICANTGLGPASYSALESSLASALAGARVPSGYEYAKELYPLWVCDDARPSCDMGSPTANDADGDGVPDADDLCPTSWDPQQTDHDGDAVGDACDPCPLGADQATCTHTPGDIDGDGVPDTTDKCPWHHDPAQTDADNDGQGDACDTCSDPSGCTTTISSLRDPASPTRARVGDEVEVRGVVVGVRSGNGFHMQEPGANAWAGVYVYDRAGGAALGDDVRVTGRWGEFNGLIQIESPQVTKLGTAAIPFAQVLSNACEIGTGGARAAELQSMLVQVGPVSVTNNNPDGPGNDYNEFEVAGCLRVDDAICPTCWADQPARNTNFTRIAGPLSFTFGNSKVLPRNAGDLVR
jgi:cytosine/adenosine deaminase-related metal-dependent hydrolase